MNIACRILFCKDIPKNWAIISALSTARRRLAMKKLIIPVMILTILSSPVTTLAATATAVIKGTKENAELLGSAHFKDTDEGLQVEISVFSTTPGLHGIHIHENGSCEDGGNAAGGHFNPDGVKHGFLATDSFAGAHAGDLGNIEVNQNGEGTLYMVVPGLTISGGKYNVEGRSVILHEKKDDFGQPTGNAGGRVGCGVIKTGE